MVEEAAKACVSALETTCSDPGALHPETVRWLPKTPLFECLVKVAMGGRVDAAPRWFQDEIHTWLFMPTNETKVEGLHAMVSRKRRAMPHMGPVQVSLTNRWSSIEGILCNARTVEDFTRSFAKARKIHKAVSLMGLADHPHIRKAETSFSIAKRMQAQKCATMRHQKQIKRRTRAMTKALTAVMYHLDPDSQTQSLEALRRSHQHAKDQRMLAASRRLGSSRSDAFCVRPLERCNTLPSATLLCCLGPFERSCGESATCGLQLTCQVGSAAEGQRVLPASCLG